MPGLGAAYGASGMMTASTGLPVPVSEAVLFQYSMYSFWYWRLATFVAAIWVALYSVVGAWP
jgi:hypothetical protein